MFGIVTKILAGALLASLLANGLLFWQMRAADREAAAAVATAKADQQTCRAATATQAAAIATLEKQRNDDQKAILDLAAASAAAQRDLQQTRGEFESYRSRLGAAALAKPELVGRLAARRVFDVMRAIGAAAAAGRAAQPGGKAADGAGTDAAGDAGEAGAGRGRDAGDDGNLER